MDCPYTNPVTGGCSKTKLFRKCPYTNLLNCSFYKEHVQALELRNKPPKPPKVIFDPIRLTIREKTLIKWNTLVKALNGNFKIISAFSKNGNIILTLTQFALFGETVEYLLKEYLETNKPKYKLIRLSSTTLTLILNYTSNDN